MKRRRLLITGVLLLLGGAIVNVAVAWGLAVWLDVGSAQSVYGLSSKSVPRWQFERLDAFGSVRIWSRPFVEDRLAWTIGAMNEPHVERQQAVPHWSRMQKSPISKSSSAVEDGRGWPAIALYEQLLCFDNDTQIDRGIPLAWRTQYTDMARIPRALPLNILWPGFAINTIFYAAILWVVFFVPGMVRRRIRRRRGLCPACAYPIGTSPVCTECGAAI